MMTSVNKYFKVILSGRAAVHFAAWFTVLLLLLSIDVLFMHPPESFNQTLVGDIIFILSWAVIYYFNTNYLIPHFLVKNRGWRYLFLLFVSTIIIATISILFAFSILKNNATLQITEYKTWRHFYLLALCVAGISFIIKITSDWAVQLGRQHELETRAMQSELNLLKSQINPHFLFNTLNSLYALSLKKSDDAPEIVIRLSEMMRYMLYECNVKQVLLSKEILYVENYLFLEKLRHKNTNIRFTVEGEPHNLLVAPLLFMAFIENAFKHGAGNHVSEGFVHIQMLIQDEEVNMFVENSKTETHPTQEHKRSGGIGLVNVKRRLTLLYPEAYNLEINDEPLSYGVNLWLNLNPNAALEKNLTFKLFDKLPLRRTLALLKLKE